MLILKNQKRKAKKNLHVRVIDLRVSTGGLDTLMQLLKVLPARTGLSYLFTGYPDSESGCELEEILSRQTRVKVKHAEHLQPIEPDRLYILPPDKNATIIDGILTLTSAASGDERSVNAQEIVLRREVWFRNMANNAPVMLWLSGEKGHRIFFNETWLRFTGMSAEESSGEGWISAVHPNDQDIYFSTFNLCHQNREFFQFEYRLRRYDGEYLWVMDDARPHRSNKDNIGYIGTTMIIHERRKVHDDMEREVINRTRELYEKNKELERSNDELYQFAFVASHDLQEPLRKIITFINRIQSNQEGELSSTSLQYFKKITQASQRMSRLINDLLEFSTVTFAERNFTEIDLNEVLKDVLQDLEMVIEEKKATCTSCHLPSIQGIPIQIRQLFLNLIGNSLKFARDDVDPEISITCRKLTRNEIKKNLKTDGARPFYELIFTDNGIGLNPEFAEQVFQIFKRVADVNKYPGTGIGLALCRRVVNNHNGHIFVAPRDHGAEFHVILPGKQGLEKADR